MDKIKKKNRAKFQMDTKEDPPVATAHEMADTKIDEPSEVSEEEPMEETQPTAKSKKKRSFSWVVILLFILLIAGLAVGAKLYVDSQNRIKQLEDQAIANVTSLSDEQIKALVNKIGQHMVMPQGMPKIVTMTSDVDRLKAEQPFFAKAQAGDKLLVYKERVILYNPASDKVVDIAQIRESSSAAIQSSTLSTPAPSATSTPEETPEPTLGESL